MAIEITKKTAAKLINAYIDSSQSRYAVDLIVNSLTGDKISKLVEILTMDEEPQTYKIGDFVGVRSTESYQVKDLIKDKSFDKLLEANLCKFTPEGYILFGMIKDSSGYGDFDKKLVLPAPFFGQSGTHPKFNFCRHSNGLLFAGGEQ